MHSPRPYPQSLGIGIRGGAVSHIRSTSSGVSPKASFTKSLILRSKIKASFARVWAGIMVALCSSESLDKAEAAAASPPPNTCGLSAAELEGLLKTDPPPPDDETIKQWIDEHRMEEYG